MRRCHGVRRLQAAIGCLTILPFGPRTDVRDADLGGSLGWFPLVGLLIGTALVGVRLLSARLGSAPVAACVVLAWVVITGALHLDGLGDVADGLYGGRTREERLRIMKDPHVGAMAVVSLALLLLLKCACLSSLPSAVMDRALLLAPCLGRYAMVLLGSTLPYARAEGGTAAPFIQYRARAWLGATVTAALGAWLTFGGRGLLLMGAALAGTVALRAMFRRALGGITGDALGASGEIIETVVLFGAALATG